MTTSRSIGQIGLDGAGTGFLPRAPEQNPADGAADYDTPGSVGLLERTRGRYGSCLAGEGGLGGGSAKGGGNDVSGSGGGGHGNSSSVARGLLFEVREFYGPCQIQIEMVSGGAGSGGGGLGGGPGGGGMVLGRCEARLSEALVGRGGSAPSATTGLVKGSSAMSASASKGEQRYDDVYPKTTIMCEKRPTFGFLFRCAVLRFSKAVLVSTCDCHARHPRRISYQGLTLARLHVI